MASAQKETKRERITKAAARLFNNTHNFNKVSIEDIAKEANVSPTTIYNNFGNRDNLIVSVIKHIHLAGLETYKAIIKADIPFPEKIKLSMERKVNLVGELDWNLIDRMISQYTDLVNFAAEINETEAKPMLLELIKDGKQQGHIDPDLSNEAIMMYLEILQESGSAFFRIINVPGVSPDILKDLNHILFYGFMNRKKENEQS
jgi:AcrR family transcriptional regulator